MVRSNSGESSPVEVKVVEIPLLTRVENGGNTSEVVIAGFLPSAVCW